MSDPATHRSTHQVFNQSEPLEGVNLFSDDLMLSSHIERSPARSHIDRLSAFGQKTGSAEVQAWARQANENPPVFKPFDRYGHRIDDVEFHPTYHSLMELGLSHEVSSAAWTHGTGGHSLHAALLILMGGADAGVCCPMSMTYACVPALRQAEWSDRWVQGATAAAYDPRPLPHTDKSGLTLGMAMTEKQGGSDVRANTTKAEILSQDEAALTGHKWFCSAPMSDGFLTLAYEAEDQLSCFLVPRWRPDGTRNGIEIQRLKHKLGDRSNASSEIEYNRAWARRVGDPGRGVRTIIDMVNHTRLDCIAGSAGLIRNAAAHAVWHGDRRTAFQKRLVDQPLMREVLAELSMEADAALAVTFVLSGLFDNAASNEHDAALARILTPIAKYWICKRAPYLVYEAMEAHGGQGYVEDSPLPRMFRQSPLNAIWEGSGNVIALDVLRALSRDQAAREGLLGMLDDAARLHPDLNQLADRLSSQIRSGVPESGARHIVEGLALCLSAVALDSQSEQPVLDAFIQRRISSRSIMLGASGEPIDTDSLIERARFKAG